MTMGVRRLFSRGKEHTFCLKNILFFSKKSKNILILAGQGGGKSPLTPHYLDAHVSDIKMSYYSKTFGYIAYQRYVQFLSEWYANNE